MNDEGLRTLLCEIMAIVNNRPLCVDTLNDVNSCSPLTPNHLLTGKSEVILPPPGNFMKEDLYARKIWKRIQYITDQFWRRFRIEVLSNFQSRKKWIKPQRNLSVGDVVLVKDDCLPRNEWLLARVIETYTSEESKVRSVKLSLGDKNLDVRGMRNYCKRYIERPIHKLVLLVESEIH